jgi:Flp pilus assembly pilin Flp
MKAQGLVEYALILVLIGVVAIVLLILFTSGGLCFEDKWTCAARKVDQCMASEHFTREECIRMISGDDQTTIIMPSH